MGVVVVVVILLMVHADYCTLANVCITSLLPNLPFLEVTGNVVHVLFPMILIPTNR